MSGLEQVVRDVSNSSDCSFGVPSSYEYLRAIHNYGIALICVGAVAQPIIVFIFVDTLLYVLKNSPPRSKSYTVFVLAVYPVTCLTCYLVILVPRSYLLSEALTQVMVMAGMYQLFCLFITYCNGESQLEKKVKMTKLSLKVGPLCCLPPCSRLPTFMVNKKILKYLRLLVLQLPIVQGLGYFIILVMWAESESLYQSNYFYLQPILIASILSGMWGMLMTIKMLKDSLNATFLLVQKFIVLQMVLIIGAIQNLITRTLSQFHVFPCNPPLTPQIYSNLIHNSLMVLEMVLLGFIARKIYKREVPCVDASDCRRSDTISTVFPEDLEQSNNNDALQGTDNNGYF